MLQRLSLAIMGLLVLGSGLSAQQLHRNGFAGRQPDWVRGASDAKSQEFYHSLVEDVFHGPPSCECLRLKQIELGSYIHYCYATPPAPLSEEFGASLWVRASRPGVQLLARVVLPKEADPEKPGQSRTVLLPGEVYQLVGKWQRLEVSRSRWAKQVVGLRGQLQRDVDTTDAYVDQLLVNVYTGPGAIDVWLDDLEIGPIREKPPGGSSLTPPVPETTGRPDRRAPGVTQGLTETPEGGFRPVASRTVGIVRDQLQIDGKPFFMRAIRHSDTPLWVLRQAGFNTVYFEPQATTKSLEEAVFHGFWVVPTLPLPDLSGSPTTLTARTDILTRQINHFLNGDAVLFWNLGSERRTNEVELVSRTAEAIRTADTQRPVTADVSDGFWAYSQRKNLNLIGAHRWPLMTSMDLGRYRDWLVGRRQLARPGTYLWTWIQTHQPEWLTQVSQVKEVEGELSEPVGPQPEQIRLLTYVALGAGCKGISYYSDRYLADSHHGRDRLLTLALLNQEIQMLEPILLSLIEPPSWTDTPARGRDRNPIPAVQTAIFRSERGLLAVPMWIGDHAQFCPAQSASTTLTVTIPQVPNGAQCWLVSPGCVRTIPLRRVIGGVEVDIPQFDLTAALVFTSDNQLVSDWQDQSRRLGKIAAQWAYDLAVSELQKVQRVHEQIARVAPQVPPDSESLLQNAKQRLARVRAQFDARQYEAAYSEALAAARPLRILMRAHWQQATRGLGDNPIVASPYAVSYYTLPQHWQLWQAVRDAKLGRNLLIGGHLEPAGYEEPANDEDIKPATAWERPKRPPLKPGQEVPLYTLPDGWQLTQDTLDAVRMRGGLTESIAHSGYRSILLEIKPRPTPQGDKEPPLPSALERTTLAVISPTVKLRPGSLVRVSAWVFVGKPVIGSPDQVMIYDNAGGSNLAARVAGPSNWTRVMLYRRVPANGEINVTMALTGIGSAALDDVRIEPLE